MTTAKRVPKKAEQAKASEQSEKPEQTKSSERPEKTEPSKSSETSEPNDQPKAKDALSQYQSKHRSLTNVGLDQQAAHEERNAERQRQRDEHNTRTARSLA